MASNRWIGNAVATAQVNTLTPANVLVGNTFTATVNGKSITYTAAAATVADVVTGLSALLSASTVPEFAEVTWAASGTTAITGTAKTAGKPFTQTSSAAGGTATLTTSTTTANAGPNVLDAAANWSAGAVPGNGDDVYIEQSTVSILYNLSALSAVTLTSLNVAASFTGFIGLPEVNADGSTSYYEYRPQALAISWTTANIGDGPGQGSGRIKLNTGSVQGTLNVRGTGTPAETTVEPLQWKGTHASNVVNLFKGSMAIAGYGGDVATVATLRVGFVTSETSDAQLRCGAGLTLTTLSMSGGTVELNAAVTTVAKTAGELTIRGTGAVTTLTDDSGTTHYLSTGTITTLSVGSDATLDFSEDMRARTVTNATLYQGGTISDGYATVSWAGGIRLSRCGIADVSIDLGQNRLISPS